MSSRLVRATSVLVSGALALALAAGTPRAEPAEPLSLRYGLYWAGFQIATLALDHDVQADGYRSELKIKSVGLIDKLTHYRADTLATGLLQPDATLQPIAFSSEYRSRKKERSSIVTFDAESGAVVDVEVTKRGKPDPSDVPAALREDVIDPLTAFFRVRAHVATAGEGQPFTAAVFDGRRRYDLEAEVIGRERAWAAGRQQPVIRVKLTLELLAGADVDDLEQAEVDDNRLELELLVSDDPRLLPLQMRLPDSTLGASIELLQDCSGDAGCQMAAR